MQAASGAAAGGGAGAAGVAPLSSSATVNAAAARKVLRSLALQKRTPPVAAAVPVSVSLSASASASASLTSGAATRAAGASFTRQLDRQKAAKVAAVRQAVGAASGSRVASLHAAEAAVDAAAAAAAARASALNRASGGGYGGGGGGGGDGFYASSSDDDRMNSSYEGAYGDSAAGNQRARRARRGPQLLRMDSGGGGGGGAGGGAAGGGSSSDEMSELAELRRQHMAVDEMYSSKQLRDAPSRKLAMSWQQRRTLMAQSAAARQPEAVAGTATSPLRSALHHARGGGASEVRSEHRVAISVGQQHQQQQQQQPPQQQQQQQQPQQQLLLQQQQSALARHASVPASLGARAPAHGGRAPGRRSPQPPSHFNRHRAGALSDNDDDGAASDGGGAGSDFGSDSEGGERAWQRSGGADASLRRSASVGPAVGLRVRVSSGSRRGSTVSSLSSGGVWRRFAADSIGERSGSSSPTGFVELARMSSKRLDVLEATHGIRTGGERRWGTGRAVSRQFMARCMSAVDLAHGSQAPGSQLSVQRPLSPLAQPASSASSTSASAALSAPGSAPVPILRRKSLSDMFGSPPASAATTGSFGLPVLTPVATPSYATSTDGSAGSAPAPAPTPTPSAGAGLSPAGAVSAAANATRDYRRQSQQLVRAHAFAHANESSRSRAAVQRFGVAFANEVPATPSTPTSATEQQHASPVRRVASRPRLAPTASSASLLGGASASTPSHTPLVRHATQQSLRGVGVPPTPASPSLSGRVKLPSLSSWEPDDAGGLGAFSTIPGNASDK